jgi:vancomycin resistance protein YoaR
VFESGLPVIQRRNHSFYISHYPKGRDATVSWGGPDLKFKNDTENWVLVSVSYTSSSITVSLYGTDPGYEVSSSTGEWTNIKPYATEEIEDPKMTKGSRVVEDPGIPGRSITVKRTVTKDGKVIREDNFVSKYRPKVQVVRVGTKETETPAKP